MMIAVIDYNMGNICSLGNALGRLGAEWVLTADHDVIRNADRVILPGVGNAAEAMANLQRLQLPELIWKLRRPVLGICVGMQVMCRHSEEGDAECMGIFDAKVKRFPAVPGIKVPHMGWSRISNLESKLFKGIEKGSYVYFVHSYYAPLCPDTIATSRHPEMYSAALKYENFYGTQFHPEKSGDVGERIIRNFLEI
ncbi:imidazole glycerol phosphate synthase subunit HisH [Muribaculaceae bacterium Isolate-037 (Harlan)]|uniref:Imidazole glycerol phosphate synthase subunit HisH n=1 Tax=Lepagella muris TaxID=3032870 RepID=A0AC61RFB1_9BACT|nr:imidazole glycerol phosphate synthase subunit HisH [Lepagella muris]ROT04601.1 imidazole glycerol phosphate synthase subunit HisH [Muribaculaceae bacterium Isolate-037 (Harlan)]TGY79306.1 imidazole glycerol phosphate synthase subunit HisH [Lepagella muris]THG52573.1 imidazole glycerol phosphate synthase subunit HisH [Bacteroidales bacterium]TKC62943.1 imidazole glycerol phosphate synthase subunit HisH [Bacteroidales bacterium]